MSHNLGYFMELSEQNKHDVFCMDIFTFYILQDMVMESL